jgi:hypothetical protein
VFGTGTVFTEGDQLPQDEQARLAVTINGVQYNAMKFVGDWDGWDLNGTDPSSNFLTNTPHCFNYLPLSCF